MKLFVFLISTLFIISCNNNVPQAAQQSGSELQQDEESRSPQSEAPPPTSANPPPASSPQPAPPSENAVKATIYYLPHYDLTKMSCQSGLRSILTVDGIELARVCPDIFKNCLMQGTCHFTTVNGPMLVNYISVRDNIARFFKVDTNKCPYGFGARSTCMDPFFTLAADSEFYKVGTVIEIPELRGIALPNKKFHNGYFVIRDRGGLIKGKGRFDIFTGIYSHKNINNPFKKILKPDFKLTYKVVGEIKAKEVLKLRNYPLLPKQQ